MKIINAKAEYLDSRGFTPYQFMERVGRVCYKSEDKITDVSAVKFIKNLAKNKHTAMLEHAHIYLDLDEMTLSDIVSSMCMEVMSAIVHNVTPVQNYFNITNEGPAHYLSGSFRAFINLFENEELSKVRSVIFIKKMLNEKYPEVFDILTESEEDILNTQDEFTKNEYIAIYTRDEFIDFINRTLDTESANKIFYKHLTHTVVFTCDRGVTHEFVRHRPASFAQESTRYCNYAQDKFNNEITVIMPCFWGSIDNILYNNDDNVLSQYLAWKNGCINSEIAYFDMINHGATSQQARDVLPTSVKTEIVITTTESEWQHIINLRLHGTTGNPHPQMVEVMKLAYFDLVKYSNNRLN